MLGEAGAVADQRPTAVVARDPRASGEFLEHAVVAVWRPAAALLRQGLLVNYRAPNGLDCRWLQLVWRPGLVSGGTLAVWLPPNTPNPSRQRLQELLAVWCSAVPLEGRAAPKFLFARH